MLTIILFRVNKFGIVCRTCARGIAISGSWNRHLVVWLKVTTRPRWTGLI